MTAGSELAITVEDPRRPDVIDLVRRLDDLMRSLYPTESNHLLDIEALAASDVTFLVARQGGEALGCGAVRRLDDALGEIKRMFVAPEARGLGIGRKLLLSMEREAARQGFQRLALETGIRQPEAIGLYRMAGYRDCLPFAAYKPDPLSRFLSKELV